MTDSMMPTIVFYILAAAVIGAAAVVAFSKNIVHSAFALFAVLLGVAGIYALLSADFIAVIQVLVYVGGISVLVLFAVMLTSGLGERATSNQSISRLGGALVLLLALGAGVVTALAVPAAPLSPEAPTTHAIGNALLGLYVLPFEVASLVLLAALLGAVTLARGWRSSDEEADRKGRAPR